MAFSISLKSFWIKSKDKFGYQKEFEILFNLCRIEPILIEIIIEFEEL